MIKLALAPLFIREYRLLGAAERKLCEEAIEALPRSFGFPHRHAGIGLRALRRGVYECRVGQALRIGFTKHADTLLLQTVGNHETLRQWLRKV